MLCYAGPANNVLYAAEGSLFSAMFIADCSNTDGRKERVQFDKITARVSRLCYGLDADHVDAAAITQKVISGVYQGVTTIELDNLVGAHLPPSNQDNC